MDTGFSIYQKRVELWNLLYPHWQSEIMTAKYVGIIVFIILAHLIWWKITDKRRLTTLLLFGVSISLMSAIFDSFAVESGLWIYRIHILPMDKSFLLHIVTITPLTLMLVLQYSPNWQQFFIWNAVGCGMIAFVVKPILSALGIYQLMYWNYLYTFILLYIVSSLARGVLYLIVEVQTKASVQNDNPLQSTLLHPAFKPLNKDSDDDKKR